MSAEGHQRPITAGRLGRVLLPDLLQKSPESPHDPQGTALTGERGIRLQCVAWRSLCIVQKPIKNLFPPYFVQDFFDILNNSICSRRILPVFKLLAHALNSQVGLNIYSSRLYSSVSYLDYLLGRHCIENECLCR